MPKNSKPRWPGTEAAERERSKQRYVEPEQPDFIAGAPNYDAFPGWAPEQVLAWLNID